MSELENFLKEFYHPFKPQYAVNSELSLQWKMVPAGRVRPYKHYDNMQKVKKPFTNKFSLKILWENNVSNNKTWCLPDELALASTMITNKV